MYIYIFYICLYIKYINVISQINYSIWCMNFIVSISYWFLKIYIINNNKPKSNTFLYKLSDILCHGGISFLTTFTLLDNKINYFNLIYTITLSIFWFLCILTPWCYFTNDNIYIFLNNDFSFIFKCCIILIILFMHFISCFSDIFISNYILIF